MTSHQANTTSRHLRRKRIVTTWPRSAVVMAGAIGLVMAAGVADAATNWSVGLAGGSSANAQGSGIANLVMSDITSAPTLTNQLSPGSSGDVQFTLQNPNPFLVTVTAVTLPVESLSSNDAVGYTNAALNSAMPGCGVTTSTVTWKGAGAATVSKSLTTGSGAFTIAAGATITVTMTNDASMDSTAPLACAGTGTGTAPNLTYPGLNFVMPSLNTVTATGGTYAGQPTTVANNGSVTTGY